MAWFLPISLTEFRALSWSDRGALINALIDFRKEAEPDGMTGSPRRDQR